MIAELLRVAKTRNLSGYESMRERPIHWFIDLDTDGHVLGFSPTTVIVESQNDERKERRGKRFKVSANYHMQWKNEKVQSVCTNDSNWLPDFLCGPANEIFPAGVTGDRIYRLREAIAAVRKHGSKHPDRNRLYKLGLWRRLIFKAEYKNPTNQIIKAVANFIRSPHRLRFSDLPITFEGEEGKRLREALDEGKETLSFRVNGRVASVDPELKKWWANQVHEQRREVIDNLDEGEDFYESGKGVITEYFPSVFGGIPFASFNKAPFISYGLGNQTTTFRLETAEKATAGLNVLLNDPTTSLKLGEEVAVFWAVSRDTGQQQAADFLSFLGQSDPLAVRDYLQGVWGVRQPHLDTTDFHVAILLKGTGRFSVRSWHTDTLANADRHIRYYFEAIRLPNQEDQTPSLRDLAWTTIAKSRGQKTKPTPAIFNAIFEAAWRGTPIPHSLFAAVIGRQRLEMAGGDPSGKEFKQGLGARTALIQLYFALKERTLTTEEKMVNAKDTAILCGRLLAMLDKIHEEAHDDKGGSSPANRLYGAASATPALVFPRLCQLARYHLQKMNGGMAHKLEFGVPKGRREDGVFEDFEGLAAIVSRLKEASGGNFPRLLTLEDQGRFALGFYYERARYWPNYKSDKGETAAQGGIAQ